MKTGRWAAVGVVLGAVTGLVWQAPASWLASGVQALSKERVQLRQPQGTMWHGSAQWVLASGAGGQDALALPQRLSWRLQPQADTSLRLELSLPCCTPEPLQLTLRPAWTGVTLEFGNGRSQWPLAWLGGLGAPWNTLQAQGWIQVNSQQAHLQRGAQGWQFGGQLRLQAQDVSVRLSTLRPLGSYQLDLLGGARTTLALTTLSGRLQLSGEGHWQGQGLVFSGEARAEPEHEAALNNLLNLMGQRQGSRSSFKIG